MTLAAYIKATGTTQGALAARLGVSDGYLSDLKSGKKRPSLDLAFRIEALTGGAVPASAWRQPPALPVPPPEDAA
ncbi:MAG: helix-turn-helix domain-containing protein [Gemmobacter sp.]